MMRSLLLIPIAGLSLVACTVNNPPPVAQAPVVVQQPVGAVPAGSVVVPPGATVAPPGSVVLPPRY
jgi:hypothetical protein